MALLAYDAPTLRQPSGLARINEKHWLARDLIFVHSGLQAFVNGSPVGGLNPIASVIGRDAIDNAVLDNTTGFAPDGSGILTFPAPVALSLPLTLSGWWYGGNASAFDAVVSVRRALGSNGGVALRRNSGEIADGTARNTAGSAAVVTATGGYVANSWQHGVAVFAANDDRRIYANAGNKNTSATSNTFPSDCTVIGVGVRDDAANTAATNALKAFALPMIVGRVLDDNEVLRLHDEQRGNPWAMFAEAPIWVTFTTLNAFNPAWARGANSLIGAGAIAA